MAPAAGLQEKTPAPGKSNHEAHFLSSIAAARQEAQTLFELSHDLGKSLRLDETLSMISTRLRRLVPFDAIAIYVRQNERLVPEHVSGDNFRLLSQLDIPVGQGLAGWVAATGEAIVNGNPMLEYGYAADPDKHAILRSALILPLQGVSTIVGVLAVYRSEQEAFTRDHLRVLQAISSKVAICVENALQFQQAESSSVTDYLTGLPNARSLFLHLDRELSRCRRSGRTLGVMVCDLNGFKAVNDKYGHLEGNRVLQTFAEAVRATCREYDYVARMGGDEFVIVAEGMGIEAATEKATVIDQLAIQAGLDVCKERLLSISVGTAFYSQDGEDAEQLLAIADRRMYLAKQRHHQQKRQALVGPVLPMASAAVN